MNPGAYRFDAVLVQVSYLYNFIFKWTYKWTQLHLVVKATKDKPSNLLVPVVTFKTLHFLNNLQMDPVTLGYKDKLGTSL